MMVVAVIGLISTPVTSRLPDAKARATSHPPPGPITSVFAPGRNTYGMLGPSCINSSRSVTDK